MATVAWGVRGEEAAAVLNEDLFIGQPVVVDNLTVWPVYHKQARKDAGSYVTLAQAQEAKRAVVRETGATAHASAQTAEAQREVPPAQPQVQAQPQREIGGQVNRLVIENRGEEPILVLAGTLVKGGKQDRQIAQDFIVPPGQTVPVDAFCVEQGRWTAQREGKHTEGVFEAQKMLANKQVVDSAQFKKDQQSVWSEVSACNSIAGKSPGTGTLMASVEETDQDAMAQRKKIADALNARLAKLAEAGEQPVGFAYAVDGKVREVRAFSHNRIFRHYTETLVNSLAMEGDLALRKAKAEKKEIAAQAAKPGQVAELVQEAGKLEEAREKTTAGNVNGSRGNERVQQSNCYAPAADAKTGEPVIMRFSVSE